jgi:hypothetical protein
MFRGIGTLCPLAFGGTRGKEGRAVKLISMGVYRAVRAAEDDRHEAGKGSCECEFLTCSWPSVEEKDGELRRGPGSGCFC